MHFKNSCYFSFFLSFFFFFSLFFFLLLPLMGDIFHSHWWYAPKNMSSSTSPYWLEQPGTLLMFICPFFIIRAPTLTGSVFVLRCHIFFQFLSPGLYIYWFYYILWLICYNLLALIYQWEDTFSFIAFNHYIWTIDFYFSITFDT